MHFRGLRFPEQLAHATDAPEIILGLSYRNMGLLSMLLYKNVHTSQHALCNYTGLCNTPTVGLFPRIRIFPLQSFCGAVQQCYSGV